MLSVFPQIRFHAVHGCGDGLARPAMQGLMLAALMLLLARHRAGRRFLDALEGPLQSILEIHPGAGGAHRRGHHHHRHGLGAGLRRYLGRFRKLIQIVFGLSIAFAASSFFLSFFSYSGGAVGRVWLTQVEP